MKSNDEGNARNFSMKNFWQFIKFAIVGVSNTLISEGVYVLLIFLKVNYVVASIAGFMLSVLNAFYWNNKYVFKEDENNRRVWWKALIKTYIAYGGGYLLSLGILFVCVTVIGLPRYMDSLALITTKISEGFDARFLGEALGELISLVITVPLNYFINKKWAFK